MWALLNLSGKKAAESQQLQLYFLAHIGQDRVHPASYTAFMVHFLLCSPHYCNMTTFCADFFMNLQYVFHKESMEAVMKCDIPVVLHMLR